jgi:hypothetical protein
MIATMYRVVICDILCARSPDCTMRPAGVLQHQKQKPPMGCSTHRNESNVILYLEVCQQRLLLLQV